MGNIMQWVLIILGLLLCVFLLTFILRQVRTQREHKHRQELQEQAQSGQRRDAVQSVRVLAMSMEQGQVELAEGSVRIHGLLQVLEPGLLDMEPYRVFRLMAEETAHMPMHAATEETPKSDLRKFAQERVALEGEHRERILEAATAIRQHEFPEVTGK